MGFNYPNHSLIRTLLYFPENKGFRQPRIYCMYVCMYVCMYYVCVFYSLIHLQKNSLWSFNMNIFILSGSCIYHTSFFWHVKLNSSQMLIIKQTPNILLAKISAYSCVTFSIKTTIAYLELVIEPAIIYKRH